MVAVADQPYADGGGRGGEVNGGRMLVAEAGKVMVAKAEVGKLMVAKADWGILMVEAEAGKLMVADRPFADGGGGEGDGGQGRSGYSDGEVDVHGGE